MEFRIILFLPIFTAFGYQSRLRVLVSQLIDYMIVYNALFPHVSLIYLENFVQKTNSLQNGYLDFLKMCCHKTRLLLEFVKYFYSEPRFNTHVSKPVCMLFLLRNVFNHFTFRLIDRLIWLFSKHHVSFVPANLSLIHHPIMFLSQVLVAFKQFFFNLHKTDGKLLCQCATSESNQHTLSLLLHMLTTV